MVERIDRDTPSYRVLSRDLVGLSTEGGELHAYGVGGVARGGMRKIVVKHYGEMGRAMQTFYYSNFSADSLAFVSEVTEHYDRPLTGNVLEREESRFYFVGGEFLRSEDRSGGVLGPSSDEARMRAAELFRLSRQLMPCALGLARTECSKNVRYPPPSE